MKSEFVHLILGGARSGKSKLAEALANSLTQSSNSLTTSKVHYIATAQNKDKEMAARITEHKKSRPSHWMLSEEPLFLAQELEKMMEHEQCVLVDCLTLWLTNWLCSENSFEQWREQKQHFLTVLEKAKSHDCQIILVSNEVGHGIVPLGELSRVFVDESGWLHQDIAKIADNVQFIMAGLPLTLKSSQVNSSQVKSSQVNSTEGKA